MISQLWSKRWQRLLESNLPYDMTKGSMFILGLPFLLDTIDFSDSLDRKLIRDRIANT